MQGRYFNQYNINTYILPYERNATIINLTVQKTSLQMRGNRVVNQGLDVDFVKNLTRAPIRKYELVNSGRAGSTKIEGDRISVFNPKFSKQGTVRPESVLSKQDVEERVERRINSRIQDLREAEIERRHREEIQRIESTQQKEVIEMRKQMQQEEARARSKAQKERIEREYKQKIERMKKTHSTEKEKVKKRHETEKKKVTKKKKK
jgi:hypothetical protein